MIDINLLPKRDKESVWLPIFLVVGLLVWLLASSSIALSSFQKAKDITQANARLNQLNLVQAALEAKLTAAANPQASNAQTGEILKSLKKQELQIGALLAEIEKALPEGSYFNQIKYSSPSSLEVSYRIVNMEDAAALIENLRRSKFVSGEVQIQEIKQEGIEYVTNFTISVQTPLS